MDSRCFLRTQGISQYIAASQFLAYSTAGPVTTCGTLAAQSDLEINSPGLKIALESSRLESASPCFFSNARTVRPFARHTTFIADLGDPQLVLRVALPIFVESSGAQTYAYSHDLDELAIGADEAAAISEMKALIKESYFLLRDEREHLGPLQRQHWAFLQRIIGET